MNKLICCDCLEGLKTLDDHSIPLVITSPPWDEIRKYGGHSWDFFACARQLWRVISDGGVLCWHVADQVEDGGETLTSFRQALFFQNLGFTVNTLVLDPIMPGASGRRYGQKAVQFVFCCSRGRPAVFNPLCDVENKYAGEVARFPRRDGETIRYKQDDIVQPFRKRSAVWELKNGGKYDFAARQHPAPFNARLVKDLMLSYSNPGQIVLDCFSGVGTTALIARKLGRRYLGFEIHQPYHDLAVERLMRAG